MTGTIPRGTAAGPRTAPGSTAPRLPRLVAGAAAGTLIWVGAMALGIPQIAGFQGHDFTIPAALLGAITALTPLCGVLYVKAAVIAVLVAVVAYTPIIDGPAHALVRRDPPPGVPPGAVVVLGADVTPDSLLYAQSLDRMLTGVELVKRGAAPLLVVPGNALEEGGRRVTALPDERRLIALAGIADSAVLVNDSIHSTRDEALRTRDRLFPRGIRRIYLVTSPLHTSRACRAFERVGITVTCTPSVSRDVPLAPGTLYRSRDRLMAFRLWLYEQAATAYYHVRGWL